MTLIFSVICLNILPLTKKVGVYFNAYLVCLCEYFACAAMYFLSDYVY